MENLRSKSYKTVGSMQGEESYGHKSKPSGMEDLRCYSATYASSSSAGQLDMVVGEQWKFQKGKSRSGVVSKSWSLNEPEVQRKKRVAGYKAFSVEGRVKGSFKNTFRWIKERYTLMIYG